MGSRGGFKFDEITAPDGSKIPIKLHKGTGTFTIEVAKGEFVNGSELEDVKTRALKWLEENRALAWKPMIAIEFSDRHGWGSGHNIALDYHRAFVAKDAKGNVAVARWEEKRTNATQGMESADIIEGEAGARDSEWRFREDGKRVILEYTPERWSALRLITRAIQQIETKLQAFLSKETASATLSAIATTGVANLLGGPKAKKEGQS